MRYETRGETWKRRLTHGAGVLILVGVAALVGLVLQYWLRGLGVAVAGTIRELFRFVVMFGPAIALGYVAQDAGKQQEGPVPARTILRWYAGFGLAFGLGFAVSELAFGRMPDYDD